MGTSRWGSTNRKGTRMFTPLANHGLQTDEISKSRNDISRPDADYPCLHDFARHVIHSTETLGVALDTVNNMIQQHAVFKEKQPQNQYRSIRASSQTRQYMHFQRQLLASLRARSEATHSRLQNEINFVRQMWPVPED